MYLHRPKSKFLVKEVMRFSTMGVLVIAAVVSHELNLTTAYGNEF